MTQVIINGKSRGELSPQMLSLFKGEVMAIRGTTIQTHTDNLLIVTTSHGDVAI